MLLDGHRATRNAEPFCEPLARHLETQHDNQRQRKAVGQ